MRATTREFQLMVSNNGWNFVLWSLIFKPAVATDPPRTQLHKTMQDHVLDRCTREALNPVGRSCAKQRKPTMRFIRHALDQTIDLAVHLGVWCLRRIGPMGQPLLSSGASSFQE